LKNIGRVETCGAYQIFLGLFVFIPWTSSASADAVISGPACVLDGNTPRIRGKAKTAVVGAELTYAFTEALLRG
jgi:hypothetical protein